MGFYSDIQIQCVNRDAYYPWYSPGEMDIAELAAKHVALTSTQMQSMGYSSKILSRLVKHGILYRYKVTCLGGGSLPSVYTTGYTAGVQAKLPVPRFTDMELLRSILIVNQVIVSILRQSAASVDVNVKRPIQVIKVNKPMGIMYARTPNYADIPLRYNLSQAIIIIPNSSYAYPGFPFRYVLEDELHYSEPRYYYSNSNTLLPVNIDFAKKEAEKELEPSNL